MRLSKWCCQGVCVIAALVVTPAGAVAPDVRNPVGPGMEFFSIDAGELVAGFNKSKIVSDPPVIKASFYQMDSSPRIVVPRGAEAYLLEPATRNNDYTDYQIVGVKPRGEPIDGSLFMLRRHPDRPRESVLAKFDFQVAGDPAVKASREDFFRGKGLHFQRLWSEEMAGSAMFRHLAMTSLKQVGKSARSTGPNWPLRQNDGVDSTIRLMSGGRAVSENLQLDTQLALPSHDATALKPLSDVRGITIREINWDNLLKKQATELDPLAKLVPHDQYAVYLPSFEALAGIVDRGGELAKPAVQWFEPQSRKTDVMGFYQQQLGLPLSALTRQFGKVLIGEVAVTGSDPYFRTGTDVAVLMQSNQPDLLHQSIVAQVTAIAAGHRDAKRVQHKVDGHLFTQWSTDNRSLSSYVARLDNEVVVSNSLVQMLQVLKCADGRAKRMHDLDEYRFFRQRYARNSKNESALVVITDAAIRRWCGPQWRISASRRTRARATIAEVTMQYADDLIRDQLTGMTEIHSIEGMPHVGSMFVSSDGVHSRQYGTLDFQTPIAEMNVRHGTTAEVNLYNNWRTRYERRWRRAFDPIGLRVSLSDKSIDADLSVIPLIMRSDYQQFMSLVGNVRLKPGAGDPHPESLASMTLALDTNSRHFQFARMIISNGTANVDLFAWIDDSVSVFFDHDPEWIKRFDARSPWNLNPGDLIREIPVGFFVPSKDNLRMTAFVVAIRATIDRFAPNMVRWENVKHGDYEYVVGTIIQGNALGQAEDMPRLYYVTTPQGLTFSTSRTVVQRAIDRQLVKKQAVDSDSDLDVQPASDTDTEPQLIMQVTGRGAEIMTRTNYGRGIQRMNRIAWSNLPILNYFRSRYPDRDPLVVYEKLFGERLLEPSGGEYQWNDDRQTYVSTLQGYHLEPQAGPSVSPILGLDDRVTTTLSFQDGGLRATMKVQEK